MDGLTAATHSSIESRRRRSRNVCRTPSVREVGGAEQKVDVTMKPKREKARDTCCPRKPVPPVTKTWLRPELKSLPSEVGKRIFKVILCAKPGIATGTRRVNTTQEVTTSA